MVVVINYSDNKFKKKQQINSWSAKNIGKVDKVIKFSPNDIDTDFFDENKEILSQKRGGGSWLWKPYIILKTLKELNEGDVLLYVDSGVIFKKNIKGLISKFKSSNLDIMLFELPLVEIQWTKKKVFDYLNITNHDLLYSNQIMGTILGFKKSMESIIFVEKWLELCRDKQLLFPSKSKKNEFKHFIAHREDQSLLSVLSKINKIEPFSDPTDYGKFNFQYLAKDRFFYTREHDKKFSLEDTYFLHNRKVNPIIYYLKYLVKNILYKFGLKKT